jgi:hypothetical protein
VYIYILLQLLLSAYPFVSSANFAHIPAIWSEYSTCTLRKDKDVDANSFYTNIKFHATPSRLPDVNF